MTARVNSSDSAPGARTIAARLDRLPVLPVHRLAVALIGFGLFFDIYEIFLAGTLSVVLTSAFGVSGLALEAVLAGAFVGQFFGAVLFGRLGDRLGRRRTFLINLTLYSTASFLGGLSPNSPTLVVTRFFAGLGIGAELALADTYLSDLLPARIRGKYVALAYTTGFLGVPVAGFLASRLVSLQPLGVAGWRWMFFFGGLGALSVGLLRRSLPESPRWLESVGRFDEAERLVVRWERTATRRGADLPPAREAQLPVPPRRPPVRTLFTGVLARRTVMQWTINALQVFGYYGFGTLAPLVLQSKGYSVVESLGFLALTYIGYPVGSLLSLPVIERVERKVLIAASALAMAVSGLLFGLGSSTVSIVAWGFVFTAVSNLFANAFHTYLGEVYPTALRSTAVGTAYSISRLVTALLPFVLIPVLDRFGAVTVYTVVALALGLLAVDVVLLGPRTTGLPLEAVSGEPSAQTPPGHGARPAPQSPGGGS
ncbi:MFS transporter [Streptomyces sp. NPDC089424]|uniref:MFS transporter n=1 Tax=Streptomyces sp. NPDC089424 TaxID=3365917 RepID=UPI003801E9E7